MRVTVNVSPGEAALLPPPPAPRDGVEWLTAAHGGDAAFVDAAAPQEVGVVCVLARVDEPLSTAPLRSTPRHVTWRSRSAPRRYNIVHCITLQYSQIYSTARCSN